jgi:hypothetical protein
LRIWGLEKAGLTVEMRRQSEQSEEFASGDPMTQAALAFRALWNKSGSFEALGRYEVRFDRQYNRALVRLTELREKKYFRQTNQRSY